MEKNKQDFLQAQANKIDEVNKVLIELFGEEFEDEVNNLKIVKDNIMSFAE